MKTFFLLPLLLLTLSARAQTNNPVAPASQPSRSVTSSILPQVTNDMSRLTGRTNFFGLAASNQLSIPQDVQQLLLSLQFDAEQLRPILSALTRGVDAAAVSRANPPALDNTTPPNQSGANFGANLGQNLSALSSANASTRMDITPETVVPRGPGTIPGSAVTPGSGITTTATENANLIQNGISPPRSSMVGTATTTADAPQNVIPNTAIPEVTPQLQQQLVTLEAELDRLLPLLNSINGSFGISAVGGSEGPEGISTLQPGELNVVTGQFRTTSGGFILPLTNQATPLSNRFIAPLANPSPITIPTTPTPGAVPAPTPGTVPPPANSTTPSSPTTPF